MTAALIVDFHVHLGPSPALGVEVEVDEVRRQMVEAGVSLAVVFPFPSMAVSSPSIVDWVASQAEASGFLIPFYYAPDDLSPPSDPRFRGVKWHWVRGASDARSNYEVLRDPRLDSFVDGVARLKLPILFEEELEFTVRFVERYVDVALVVPHLGMLGGPPRAFLERLKRFDNVYFDTSLAPAAIVSQYLEALGAGRLIFGSDVPFGFMPSELAKLRSLKLSGEEAEAILGGNAVELMRLKPAPQVSP